VYISRMWGQKPLSGLTPNIFVVVDIRDLIKFGDDRFRGLASAEGHILPFPIDFDGHDTLTLPCERVMVFEILMHLA